MDTFTIDIKAKAMIEACGQPFKVNGAMSVGDFGGIQIFVSGC